MLNEIMQAMALPVYAAAREVQPVIVAESTWLGLIKDPNEPVTERAVSASRWTGFTAEAREQVSEVDAGCHLLAIALRPMDITAFAAGKLFHEGRMQQGTMRLSEPGLGLRCIFRGGYDALHLHIRNSVIAEFADAGGEATQDAAVRFAGSQPIVDPLIERLGHALIRADDFGGTFGQCYADSIGLAIVARLLAKNDKAEPGASGSRVSGLPKWRLKRATDFIAAHLGDPIGLAEIAASTGLTRMHFAAQFRASTGLRPHDYLVRRRIERAQELLAGSQLSLAEIALEVGFKAQAHFTTVFAKVVGETPHAWRRKHYVGP
jgi:AraC-like DNA-binding protein